MSDLKPVGEGILNFLGIVKGPFNEEELGESLSYNSLLIVKFVDQQKVYSINLNGTVERNVILNEFRKFCYENKHMGCSLKNDDIIERVKDEYWKREGKGLSKKEFFETFKPNKFKYNW